MPQQIGLGTTTAVPPTTTSSYLPGATSATVGNAYITWKNRGSQTDFTVTSPLANGISTTNAWLGVGLNSRRNMVNNLKKLNVYLLY